jgi:hypothetical protein
MQKLFSKDLKTKFIETLQNIEEFRYEDGNPFFIKIGEHKYYLFVKNLSPAYFKNSPDVTRVQLPYSPHFSKILRSDIPFIIFGYDVDTDSIVAWNPNRIKERLNTKSNVSLYSRNSLQVQVKENEFKFGYLNNGEKIILFKRNNLMNFFTSFLELFNRTDKNTENLSSKEDVNVPPIAEFPHKLLEITDHTLLQQLKPLLKNNQVLQAVEITSKYYSDQYNDMVFKDWYSLVSDLYKKEQSEIQIPEIEKNTQSQDKIINETIQKKEAVLQEPNNKDTKKFTKGLSIPQSKKIKKSNTNAKNFFSNPEFLVFTTLSNAYKIQNKGFSSKSQIIAEVNFDKTEKPIYITGTKQYNGFLFVAFENGKAAKISFSSFKTELKRKKLRNAFSNESKLIFIEHFESDIDLIALSSINKVALFNTCMINEKDSRTSKGVQVMKSKDESYMKSIKKLNQVKLIDPEYYRKDSGLNVVGYYLKQGDEI